MKKLMIAAAIVCAAIASQAASASWELAKDATYKYNQVFMIKSSDAAAVISLLDAGGDGMMAALKEDYILGDVANASKYGAIGAQFATVSSDQNAYKWVLIKTTDSARTITDGTTGYVVSGEKTYSSMLAAGNISEDPTVTASAMDITSLLASGTSGTIGNVPEPTSAMLLLLGVAGLALRRRCA